MEAAIEAFHLVGWVLVGWALGIQHTYWKFRNWKKQEGDDG